MTRWRTLSAVDGRHRFRIAVAFERDGEKVDPETIEKVAETAALLRSLGHRIRQHAIHADNGKRERDCRKNRQQYRFEPLLRNRGATVNTNDRADRRIVASHPVCV